VMPQFTPSNPNLLSVDPNNVTTGMLASFQVQDSLNRLKAFQIQEQEKALLAADRLAAAKAEYSKSVMDFENIKALSPSANQAGVARNLATVKTAGPLADLTLTKAASEIKDLESKEKLRGPTDRLTESQITSQTKDLAQKETLRPVTEKTAGLKAQYDQENAQFGLDTLGDKQALIEQELAFDLDHSADAKSAEIAYKKAQTKLLLAQAEKFQAEAEGSGRFEKDPFTHWQKMNGLENQLVSQETKLLNQPVILPNGREGNIIEYIRATRSDPSKVDSGNKSKFLGMGNVSRNPEAEALIGQIKALRDRRKSVSDKIDKIDLDVAEAKPEQPKETPEKVTIQKISSKEEYDKLKSGQEFIGPDGKPYKKP
jgi:hypothetical protein